MRQFRLPVKHSLMLPRMNTVLTDKAIVEVLMKNFLHHKDIYSSRVDRNYNNLSWCKFRIQDKFCINFSRK